MTDTITLVRGGGYPIPASLTDSSGGLIAGIDAWTIRADAVDARTGAVLVALTTGNGKITVGATAADITFILSDADIALLPLGRLSKLKVTLTDAAGRDYVASAWLSMSRDGDAQSGAAGSIAMTFADATIAMSFDARQGPQGAAGPQGPQGPQGAPGVNPAGAVVYDQAQSLTPPQKVQVLSNLGLAAFTGDSGSGGAGGLVPAPAAGDAAASKFLKADGIWTTVTAPVTSVAGRAGAVTLAQADIAGLTTGDTAQFAGLRFSTDLFLTRAGGARLQIGAADAAAPVAQTLQAQSAAAGAANTAGQKLIIAGSAGTGTGAGGDIDLQVAVAGAAGSAQNAPASALLLSGTNRSALFSGMVRAGAGLASGSNSVAYGPGGGQIAADTFITTLVSTNPALALSPGGYGGTKAGLLMRNDQSLIWDSSATSAFAAAQDLGLRRSAAGVLEVNNGTGGTFRDLKLRDLHAFPQASLAPSANGELVVEATSNTTLTFKLKGSDGVVRSGTLTLA